MDNRYSDWNATTVVFNDVDNTPESVANPWASLPREPDFVLPEDEAAVRFFNDKKGSQHDHFLHIDKILPEAFVGARDAPVVLLSNNPGFGSGAPAKENQSFKDRMRSNLLHEASDYPFVFLDPKFSGLGKKWWATKLKEVIEAFENDEKATSIVARSILNVPYFPYPSRKFGHRRLRLPSQEYSFGLIRRAIKRGAVIVFMRREKMWMEAVPELKGYTNLTRVGNKQNPTISRRNCEGFEKVVQAIRISEGNGR